MNVLTFSSDTKPIVVLIWFCIKWFCKSNPNTVEVNDMRKYNPVFISKEKWSLSAPDVCYRCALFFVLVSKEGRETSIFHTTVSVTSASWRLRSKLLFASVYSAVIDFSLLIMRWVGEEVRVRRRARASRLKEKRLQWNAVNRPALICHCLLSSVLFVFFVSSTCLSDSPPLPPSLSLTQPNY